MYWVCFDSEKVTVDDERRAEKVMKEKILSGLYSKVEVKPVPIVDFHTMKSSDVFARR